MDIVQVVTAGVSTLVTLIVVKVLWPSLVRLLESRKAALVLRWHVDGYWVVTRPQKRAAYALAWNAGSSSGQLYTQEFSAGWLGDLWRGSSAPLPAELPEQLWFTWVDGVRCYCATFVPKGTADIKVMGVKLRTQKSKAYTAGLPEADED